MSGPAAGPGGAESRPEVDRALFRRAVDRFASGVCVVSTRRGSHDYAITVSSFLWVSTEPRLVCASVHEDARFLDAVADAGTWGVSVLAERGKAAASWLATPGRPVLDQLARVPHRRGPVTGAALLEDAVATFECATEAEHPAGDHVLLVGRVLTVELGRDEPPLLYSRGDYAGLRPGGLS